VASRLAGERLQTASTDSKKPHLVLRASYPVASFAFGFLGSAYYCPTRGLGEKPSPLGEDFSMPEGQEKPQNIEQGISNIEVITS